MRRHANVLADGATVEAEIAVLGSGPLGIVVALELGRAGRQVVLVESGHRGPSQRAQRLSALVGDDPYHVAMDLAVRRQIGGTSNTWGGRCVPFDPIDFDVRPWSRGSWPIRYAEVEKYFQRACDWCRCGRAIFSANDLPEFAGRSLIPGLRDGRVMTSALERWSLPTNFRVVYGAELERRPTIDLITGLTCTSIALTPDGSAVDHLVCRSEFGTTTRAKAKMYVLATGGLEATRLLFASNDRHPGGIGNDAGHLGRWYMAHVQARAARLCLTGAAADVIYGHERDVDGVYVRRRFTFSRDWQHEARLPNAALWIINPDLGDPRHGNAVLSMVYLLLRSSVGARLIAEGIRRDHLRTAGNPRVASHLRNIAVDILPALRFAATFAYGRYLRPGRKVPGFFVRSASGIYPLMYHGEHLPHWESFVEPTTHLDALGMPRLRTHIQFSREDCHSVSRGMEQLDEYLREHGVGRVALTSTETDQLVRGGLHRTAGYHQTGTTRMSEHPADGVVTKDLAVHGFEDLFIASTSTFPSSGQANPTFMGIVFAVRLADHIRGLLGDAFGSPRRR
jgi:choline dehydrogenase-like flavoprotein